MNQDLIHQHTIQFQRIINTALKESYNPALELSYKQIRQILLAAENLSSAAKVARITAEINRIIAGNLNPAWEAITRTLEEIAVYESGYVAGVMATGAAVSVSKPTASAIEAYMTKALMSLQTGDTARVGTWGDYVKRNVRGTAEQIDNLVKMAYVRGDGVKEAADMIRIATQGQIKRSAEALARTGAQHYAVQAREALFEENDDIITGFYYAATLDNRTTIFCAANDGKTFKPDEKRPQLPAHWNCRSSYVPLILGQELPDGERPAVGAGEDYESGDKYQGRKSVKSGEFKVKQVKPSTNYESWLRRQPVAFQNDVLGIGRAKLFREGAQLESFLDITGKPLTLEELKGND